MCKLKSCGIELKFPCNSLESMCGKFSKNCTQKHLEVSDLISRELFKLSSDQFFEQPIFYFCILQTALFVTILTFYLLVKYDGPLFGLHRLHINQSILRDPNVSFYSVHVADTMGLQMTSFRGEKSTRRQRVIK